MKNKSSHSLSRLSIVKLSLFNILLSLLFTNSILGQSSNQQYQILEDKPIATAGYLGIGIGYNSKSASNTHFDYQGHFLKGRISLAAEYGFEGLLNGMINEKVTNKYDEALRNSNSNNFKEKILHPNNKLKLGSDYELVLGYNFSVTKKLKNRKIYTAQDRLYKYYVKREMTEINLTGARLGFGSYRGTLFGKKNEMFGNSFTLPEFTKGPKWDSVLNVFTNYYSSYIFIGAQTTFIRSVEVSDLKQKRRALNSTLYFDLLMLLNKRIDNVRYHNENKEYTITQNNKRMSNKIGARIGVQFRATRHAFLFYGLEGGYLPGFNIPHPSSEFESKVDVNPIISSLYFKLRVGISLTSPSLKIKIN